MLQFQVDLQSEALQTLQRIINMDTKPLLRNISKTLYNTAQSTYKKAWGGMRPIGRANTVYAAVKKSLFPETARRGFLTGSTWESIEAGVEGNEAWAGVRGSWPKTSGRESAPMDAVIENLEEVWGRNKAVEKRMGLGIQDRLTNRLATTRRTNISFPGELVMSWDTSGLRIQWPTLAKKIFGLKDIEKSAKPYATKTFGRTGMKDLFYIAFEKDLMDDANVFLNKLISGDKSISAEEYDVGEAKPTLFAGQVDKTVWEDGVPLDDIVFAKAKAIMATRDVANMSFKAIDKAFVAIMDEVRAELLGNKEY